MISKDNLEKQLLLVLQGNWEAIEQGVGLLNKLTDAQYVYVAEPYLHSSIGQHFRHILDIYHSIINALHSENTASIDYNLRRRSSIVETNRVAAIDELRECSFVLGKLNAVKIQSRVEIITEVLLSSSQSFAFSSSVARELIFASSHAVHHFAIIGIAAKLQGIDTEESFGVAPATATFFRLQSAKD